MSFWQVAGSAGFLDLETTFGYKVTQQPGQGMAPVSNISSTYGLLDGALYQRTRTEAKQFTLIGTLRGSTVADLHLKRKNLISAIAPDRAGSPGQPILLRYTGGASTLQASAFYRSGMELGNVRARTEANISFTLEQFDPYWEKITSSSATLTVQSTVTNANYILQRSACGVWGALGSGMNGTVFSIASASDGRLIVGGSFTEASGGTACRVAEWNGAWRSLGNAANDVVYAVAVGVPFGEVFVGGGFTSLSGFTANKFGRFDGLQWRTAASGVQSGSVFDIKRDNDGNIIAVGAFITAGSAAEVAACNIAKWNTSTCQWQAVASGLRQTIAGGLNAGQVRGLDISSNNDYWVVGRFNAAGLTSNTACRIAKYTQSTSAWQAVGGCGLAHSTDNSTTINDIALVPDGLAHVGLNFETEWNTSYYSSNGTNLAKAASINSDIYKTYVDPNGIVYLGGKFTVVNTLAACSMVRLIGSHPFRMDVQLPAAPVTQNVELRAIHTASDGALTIGWNTTGTASAAAVTQVTNSGGAATYPILTASGPTSASTAVIQLVNYTTGDAIYFNLNLAKGEIVTLDLRPNKKTFTSNIRGNIINSIVPGSNVATWRLLPGANNISFWLTGGSGTAQLTWTERFWSIDN